MTRRSHRGLCATAGARQGVYCPGAKNLVSGGAMTFEELVAGRLTAVLRLAAVLTGNRADAEDVVQEVLVRAHRDWRKLSRMDRPDLYLRKMVVNEFLSARRRRWRLVPSGGGSEVDDRVTPDYATTHAE